MNETNNNKSTIYIITILVVIALIVGFFYFRQPKKEEIINDNSYTLDIGKRKEEIVAVVNSGKNLADSEKKDILKDIVGESFQKYEFSEDEKIKIVQALNN